MGWRLLGTGGEPGGDGPARRRPPRPSISPPRRKASNRAPARLLPRPTISGSPATGIGSTDRYVWRAGYWGRCQPDWVWIPARYVWTPGGYVFLAGHWDYALAKRGVVFCPVYFANAYYVAPTYYYTPSVCIETPVLTGYLFCRPAYGHYYFGDYYDPMYVRVGIYPWYAVHEGRYGYEPLFVYDRWYYGRRDPGWEIAHAPRLRVPGCTH